MTSFVIILNPFSCLFIDRQNLPFYFKTGASAYTKKKSKIVENSNKQKIDL